MFIAHAPVGYLLGSSFIKRAGTAPITATMAIWVSILGSLAPDVDMLYFYLIDHRQTHHHKYLTHWPVVWLTLLVCALGWRLARRHSRAATASVLFAACALVHLLMDTIVGDIWWLAPLTDNPFSFFTVQARFTPWWLNFVLHWSFALELGLLAWALARYRRSRRVTLR
ncbi:MAG: metal-dependent hydrolase [Gammaproteobacteria bacterium]